MKKYIMDEDNLLSLMETNSISEIARNNRVNRRTIQRKLKEWGYHGTPEEMVQQWKEKLDAPRRKEAEARNKRLLAAKITRDVKKAEVAAQLAKLKAEEEIAYQKAKVIFHQFIVPFAKRGEMARFISSAVNYPIEQFIKDWEDNREIMIREMADFGTNPVDQQKWYHQFGLADKGFEPLRARLKKSG